MPPPPPLLLLLLLLLCNAGEFSEALYDIDYIPRYM